MEFLYLHGMKNQILMIDLGRIEIISKVRSLERFVINT